MALLCMEHASVKYDRFNLDVSLTVEPGMITGLIGRNGSGKTTTFKAIVDVVRAGGKTEIFGKDNRRLTEDERSMIGIAYTDIFFSGEYKVSAVRRILKAAYKNFNAAEYDRLIKRFDIPQGGKIRNLSTGELAKLRFVSAMSHDAKLVILDEPTSGLDVVARDGILDELRNYMERHEDAAIILSSNITQDLEGLTDDVYMIDEGRIVLHENTDTITDDYGLVKCTEEQFEKLDKEYVKGVKKAPYGRDVLVSQKRYYLENYPALAVEDGTLDQCLVVLAGKNEEDKK
ncbi:MAG: ABC transporter ATP-binding protein [Clostridiales bacterium]|nr:ABC transporter ATP-binding protein [Clostridiales bacterium]